MRVLVGVILLAALANAAAGENHARMSRADLVRALRAAGPHQFDHVDGAHLSIETVRVLHCIGPDEEPTEFECVWVERTAHGAKKHRNWFAIDGEGWRLID